MGQFAKLRRVSAIVFFNVAALLLIAEGASRYFWHRHGIPFWSAPSKILWFFYPDLKIRQLQEGGPCGDCFDVLFLGGSTMHQGTSSIEAQLREQLARASRKRIRIFNMATPAQTIIDSAIKYKQLESRRFNLVVLYVGINEVRANNCPPEIFRSDFSHYSWYRNVWNLVRNADGWFFVFPYTVSFLYTNLHRGTEVVPVEWPKAEWVHYGCTVKTAEPLRDYMEQILRTAERKKEPVVLMTFSYYLPTDYTLEKFRNRGTDYTTHSAPVEVWGKPECVVAGLEAHNAVIRDLARRPGDTIFVDQQSLIPQEGLYFNDICHLTTAGSERFVKNLMEGLKRSTVAQQLGPARGANSGSEAGPVHAVKP